MVDDDLKLSVAAAVAGRVQEFGEFYGSLNIGRLLAKGAGVGGTYGKVSDVVSDKNFLPAVWAELEKYAGAALEKKTGLVINEISEEGLARAIGVRAGFELRSLHDMDIVGEDLIRAASEKIEARMGVEFGRVIRRVDDLIAALERRAAAEIEKRVFGLVLHDLSDPGRVADDVAKWAADKVTSKTGIPLRDIRDPDKTKNDLIRWAEPEIRKRLGVSGSSIGGGLKMTKKAIRNRMAQRRFYAAHGNLKVYAGVS